MCLTWRFVISIARAAHGRDLIRENEIRRKNWTCRWFHTDYFITEYLFSGRLTLFKSRHVKLSIDIFLMSLCKVFAAFQLILVTRFKKQFAERVKTENLFVFFNFQKHIVVIMSVYK